MELLGQPKDSLDGFLPVFVKIFKIVPVTILVRFLYRVRHESLTLSAMAFQDAMNLNVERLPRCSLHVYDGGRIVPFCAYYLSAMPEQTE